MEVGRVICLPPDIEAAVRLGLPDDVHVALLRYNHGQETALCLVERVVETRTWKIMVGVPIGDQFAFPSEVAVGLLYKAGVGSYLRVNIDQRLAPNMGELYLDIERDDPRDIEGILCTVHKNFSLVSTRTWRRVVSWR
jgi:hypothetical protein